MPDKPYQNPRENVVPPIDAQQSDAPESAESDGVTDLEGKSDFGFENELHEDLKSSGPVEKEPVSTGNSTPEQEHSPVDGSEPAAEIDDAANAIAPTVSAAVAEGTISEASSANAFDGNSEMADVASSGAEGGSLKLQSAQDQPGLQKDVPAAVSQAFNQPQGSQRTELPSGTEPVASSAEGSSPTSAPNVVDGTEGSDVVDARYVGDPEGEVIDSRSRTGIGSDDDVVELRGGDDTYFAGLGSDTILGGEGRDTYIVDSGPFVIADPVRTSFDETPDLSAVEDTSGASLFASSTIISFKRLDIGGSDDTGEPISALDGGIEVREPSVDGDPADLGGFATEFTEDQLGFYLRSLPEDGRLFLQIGSTTAGDPIWREIQASETVPAGSSPDGSSLRLEAGDAVFWVADENDITIESTVAIGGLDQPLSVWENPSPDLNVRLTATDLEGNSAAIVTQSGVPGSDGATTSEFVNGGLGIAGLGPNVENDPGREAEINRGFGEFDGRSEELRVEFTDADGEAQLVTNAQIYVSSMFALEGEVGTVTLLRDGELIDELTFGPFDPTISQFEPDLIVTPDGTFPTAASGFISLDGYIFDTVILSSSNVGLLFPADFSPDDISEFYVDGIFVDPVTGFPDAQTFDYFVEAPDGSTSIDAQVQLLDKDGEVLRLAIDDAPISFEGGDAVFTVGLFDDSGNPTTSAVDTVVTLSLVDGTATQLDGGGNLADFSNPDPANATSDVIEVTILAGQSSTEVAIPILDDGLAEDGENFFLQYVSAENANSAVVPSDLRATAVIGNPLQADPVTTSWGVFTDNLINPSSSFGKEFTIGGTLDGAGPEISTTTSLFREGFVENGISVPGYNVELTPLTGPASLGGDNLGTPGEDPNLQVEITSFPIYGLLYAVNPNGTIEELSATNNIVETGQTLFYEQPRETQFQGPTNFDSSPLSGVDETGTKNIVASEAGSIVNIREMSFGITQVTTTGRSTFELRANESFALVFDRDMSYLQFQGAFNSSFASRPFAQNWGNIELLNDGEVVLAGTIGTNALANSDIGAPPIDFVPDPATNTFSFSGVVFDEVLFTNGPTVPGLIGGRSTFGFFDLYAAGELDLFEYRVIDPVLGLQSESQLVTIVHPDETTPEESQPLAPETGAEEELLPTEPEDGPLAPEASLLAPDEIPDLQDLEPETITVTVNDQGDGTVEKLNQGQTDEVFDVQNFVAAENPLEQDTIRLSTRVTDPSQVVGVSDLAEGTFTLDSDGSVITFGPAEAQTFSEVLNLGLAGTFEITSGDESGQVGDISFENFEVISFDTAVCFLRGTMIDTPFGECSIENLRAGDSVLTADGGEQKIQWTGSFKILAQGNVAPVRFEPRVIGNREALYLSPQHRVYVEHYWADLLFGEPEVLVPAKAFVNGTTVTQDAMGVVEYFHIMLDNHHVLFANGSKCESLLPAEVADETIRKALRERLMSDVAYAEPAQRSGTGSSAYMCLTFSEGKVLLSEIAKSKRILAPKLDLPVSTYQTRPN